MTNDYERAIRQARDAATRFQHAVLALHCIIKEDERQPVRALCRYEAERLLFNVLLDGDMLARLLPDDDFANCERMATVLARTLRRERVARELTNTEGRTTGEVATFEAKARALRGEEEA